MGLFAGMKKVDNNDDFRGYIKYFGPFTEDGSLDIGKAGRSLLALDRFLKKYQSNASLSGEKTYVLKISSVNKNCSEIVVSLVEAIKIHAAVGTNVALIGLGLNFMGVGEFGKKFFGTLGEQLALKIFAKGNKLKKEKDVIKNQKIYTQVKNTEGSTKEIPLEEWENYEKLNSYLDGFIQLEKGKEEEMKLGYKHEGKENEVAVIKYEQKDYFDGYGNASVEERMSEPFDEANAKEEKIIGRFVDFYGLAHKYHFAFQARKKQEDIGKQKILCIVEKDQISKILDYLKPENSKNICIFGKAIRDWENKVDKIKIQWVSEDEDHNPDQLTID